MKIIEVKGDITNFPQAEYICHQCNCVTSNSAHLAKTVFGKFPWADIYKERESKTIDYKNFSKGESPGDIIVRGNGKDQRYVINMLAQAFPGKPKFPDSKLDGTKARERYFLMCLKKILDLPNIKSIAFPSKIGCGAAGGDWGRYKMFIEKFAEHLTDVQVYIVDFN